MILRRLSPVLLLAAFGVSPARSQVHTDSADILLTRDVVDPARIIELKQIARIGNATDDPDHLLASGGPLVVDLVLGEVFLADGMDKRIKVFSLDGTLQRAWGRRGEGPGEFMGGMGLAVARDTVIVSDATRVHTFQRNGEHISTVVPRGRLPITLTVGVAGWAGGWWMTQREIEPGVTGAYPFRRTYSFSPSDGIREEWVYQEPWTGPGPNGILAHSPSSAFHGEGFVDAPNGDYELRVLQNDGTLSRVLRFVDEAIPVPANAKGRYEDIARERCRDHRVPSFCQSAVDESLSRTLSIPLPETRPVVGRLIGSGVGLILVQRIDLDPDPFLPGGEESWDLVEDSGKWVGRIEFVNQFEPKWLGDGQVWGIERGEFDVPFIVGYGFEVPYQ